MDQLLRSRGAPEPAELNRAMEIIERNARAQVRLIDDLLDLSRIMSGRFRLDVRQVALVDIARSALDSIEPTAQTKGVRLESFSTRKRGRFTAIRSACSRCSGISSATRSSSPPRAGRSRSCCSG